MGPVNQEHSLLVSWSCKEFVQGLRTSTLVPTVWHISCADCCWLKVRWASRVLSRPGEPRYRGVDLCIRCCPILDEQASRRRTRFQNAPKRLRAGRTTQRDHHSVPADRVAAISTAWVRASWAGPLKIYLHFVPVFRVSAQRLAVQERYN